MSDTNSILLSYDQETVYGVADVGPTMKDLRLTGEGLKRTTAFEQSAEIRSDRQVPDEIRLDVSAGGPINGEFSFSPYDDFMEAALLSASWTASLTSTFAANEVTPSVSGTNLVLTTTGAWAAFVTGNWVRVSGMTTTANHGYWKVITKTTTVLTLGPGTGTATAGAAQNCNVRGGSEIVAGTTFRSFSIEKQFTDLTNVYQLFLGMAIDAWTLGVNVKAKLTTSFGFIGKTDQKAVASLGSHTAAPTNPIMNAVDNVVAFLENSLVFPVTSFSLNLRNNLRARSQVGTLGAVSIGKGAIGLSGTLQAYFENQTLLDHYRDNTPVPMTLVLQESALANAYVIDLPRVKFTDAGSNAGASNQDVMSDTQWTAYMHPTETKTLRITRIA